jgi:S-adenosylmethionine:diacylglycerol 3-amino-3-carboxypropyl transferase
VTSATPWESGTLSSRKGAHRLLFGQMHEDAEIEREAFAGKSRVFCIASAGNTAFALAAEHEVVACDINPVQLAYAERRAKGHPLMTGDAERAMSFARTFTPLIGWSHEDLRAFLSLSHTVEQIAFWRDHLDTLRFRAALDVLLSRSVLRTLYAPELLSILPPKFGAVLRSRLERGFATHANAANPYAHSLLLGETSERRPPTATNLQFALGDAASFLESCPPESFDGFALSNILDGTSPSYGARVFRAVRRAATESALVVLRSFAEPSQEHSINHAARDRSMLWGVVDIRSAHAS